MVSDTGPGVPECDRSRLFERHYRGVQAQGEIPGTGIGLALVKELVEQMGGELMVVSPAGCWSPWVLAAGQGGDRGGPDGAESEGLPPDRPRGDRPSPDRPASPGTAFCFRFPHGSAPSAPALLDPKA